MKTKSYETIIRPDLKRIINSMNYMVFACEIEESLPGKFVYVNSTALCNLDYSEKEFLEMNYKDILLDQEFLIFEIFSAAILENSQTEEIYYKKKSGRTIPVKANIFRVIIGNRDIFIIISKPFTNSNSKELKDQFRIEFKEIIRRIFEKFIHSADFDKSINATLMEIGNSLKAGVSIICFFSEDKTIISTTYKWLKQKSPKNLLIDNGMNISKFPWAFKKLINNEGISIIKPSGLPKEARNEKELLGKLNIKNLIVVPLHSNEDVLGFMAVGNLEDLPGISNKAIFLLEEITRILENPIKSYLNNNIDGEKRESQKKYFVKFNAPFSLREKNLKQILAMINENVSESLELSYSGIIFLDRYSEIAFEDFYNARLRSHNHNTFKKVNSNFLKKIAAENSVSVKNEKIIEKYMTFLSELGIRSLICVPINLKPELKGFLFACDTHNRKWTDKDHEFLDSAAKNICKAIQENEEQILKTNLWVDEQRFRRLLENSTDVLFDLSFFPKLNFQFISPSIAELTGYTQQDFYNNPYLAFKIINSEDIPLLDFSKNIDLENAPILRLITKDGRAKYIKIKSYPVFSRFDERIAVEGSIRDITEKMLKKEIEIFHTSILEKIPGALMVLDSGGKIRHWNKVAENLSGWKATEIIGKSIEDFLNEDENIRQFKDYKESLQKHNSFSCKTILKRKNGKKIPIFLSAAKIKDFESNRHAFIVLGNDLSELENMQKALQKSEKKFKSIFENASIGIVLCKIDGSIVEANDIRASFHGYTRNELIKMNIKETIHPDELDKLEEVFEEFSGGKFDSLTCERKYINKNGETLWGKTNISILRGETKNDHRLIIVTEDITEEKEAKMELKKSYEKLSKNFKSLVNSMSKMVEIKDSYTASHQQGVAELACRIARELKLSRYVIEGLHVASLLHDIGKIALPSGILNKSGNLSNLEFELIKEHPKVGFDILNEIDFPWPIASIVFQHHERVDGSGYPNGLKGQEISIEARIIGVADTIEAIISHRPYRPALGKQYGLEEISNNSGTLYDPKIVKACLKVFENGFEFERK